ncbi:MAG: GspE/PulE family protein, partial [Candidatus Saccharimonadales bacterium]
YGLIILSGPTGSGKTTTLYALLRTLNEESTNIVTLEDPIEYSIDGINQSQVKPEIGYDFGRGLRQILRQDPNIIMVGEVRDKETAGLVINSALTGHLVLSTLHTNSAVGVIPRLIDMGVMPFLIPTTLKVAISQRLVRILCNYCKKKIGANERVKAYLEAQLKTMPLSLREQIHIPDPIFVYEATGCQECSLAGYRGRTGLFEVLRITDSLADIIIKTPYEPVILKAAQKQGMLTMAQEGVLKILAGETSVEEVTRVTEEQN